MVRDVFQVEAQGKLPGIPTILQSVIALHSNQLRKQWI